MVGSVGLLYGPERPLPARASKASPGSRARPGARLGLGPQLLSVSLEACLRGCPQAAGIPPSLQPHSCWICVHPPCPC